MPRRIKITAGSISSTAALEETPTADAIWEAVPFEGAANRWGEEIYFTIPILLAESEDARQDMAVGELGYWPTGSAFCVFFGPTPASDGDKPRAYSNVNPFGRVEGDAAVFKAVKDGEKVTVEKAES